MILSDAPRNSPLCENSRQRIEQVRPASVLQARLVAHRRPECPRLLRRICPVKNDGVVDMVRVRFADAFATAAHTWEGPCGIYRVYVDGNDFLLRVDGLALWRVNYFGGHGHWQLGDRDG